PGSPCRPLKSRRSKAAADGPRSCRSAGPRMDEDGQALPGCSQPRSRQPAPLSDLAAGGGRPGAQGSGDLASCQPGLVREGRQALHCGDYGAFVDETVVAVVERKTLENLATSLSDGTLSFQMQRLAEIRRAAVVVEGDYPDLFRIQPGCGSWLADMLGRLTVRYPEVPVIFAGSRRFAEEWAYRFLEAAAAERVEST